MTFNEWINKVVSSGNLCDEYSSKIENAKSRKALMDVVLDVNGAEFIQKMDANGIHLPYETIKREFSAFINGRYVAEYEGRNGAKYTSALYCCYDDAICEVDTAIITLLGCNTTLKLKENSFTLICVDKNCNIVIDCPKSSTCRVKCWGGANINVLGFNENVKVIKQ